MMDGSLTENTNLVRSHQTEEKQSVVGQSIATSGNLEAQFDLGKKGRSGPNEAKDLLNNQVSNNSASDELLVSYTIAGMRDVKLGQLGQYKIMYHARPVLLNSVVSYVQLKWLV